MIRLYASIGLILALVGGGWYVSHVIKQNAALKADLRASNDELRRVRDHVRQRIKSEREQAEVNYEAAKIARMARDRATDTAERLRRLRSSAIVPTFAASQPDGARDCAPPIVAIATTTAAESAIDKACAETDAELSVLKSEIMRLNERLSALPE